MIGLGVPQNQTLMLIFALNQILLFNLEQNKVLFVKEKKENFSETWKMRNQVVYR